MPKYNININPTNTGNSERKSYLIYQINTGQAGFEGRDLSS